MCVWVGEGGEIMTDRRHQQQSQSLPQDHQMPTQAKVQTSTQRALNSYKAVLSSVSYTRYIIDSTRDSLATKQRSLEEISY